MFPNFVGSRLHCTSTSVKLDNLISKITRNGLSRKTKVLRQLYPAVHSKLLLENRRKLVVGKGATFNGSTATGTEGDT